jgi:hypothetical protein
MLRISLSQGPARSPASLSTAACDERSSSNHHEASSTVARTSSRKITDAVTPRRFASLELRHLLVVEPQARRGRGAAGRLGFEAGQFLRCEPDLSEAARPFGFASAPFPEAALLPPATLAYVTWRNADADSPLLRDAMASRAELVGTSPAAKR